MWFTFKSDGGTEFWGYQFTVRAEYDDSDAQTAGVRRWLSDTTTVAVVEGGEGREGGVLSAAPSDPTAPIGTPNTSELEREAAALRARLAQEDRVIDCIKAKAALELFAPIGANASSESTKCGAHCGSGGNGTVPVGDTEGREVREGGGEEAGGEGEGDGEGDARKRDNNAGSLVPRVPSPADTGVPPVEPSTRVESEAQLSSPNPPATAPPCNDTSTDSPGSLMGSMGNALTSPGTVQASSGSEMPRGKGTAPLEAGVTGTAPSGGGGQDGNDADNCSSNSATEAPSLEYALFVLRHLVPAEAGIPSGELGELGSSAGPLTHAGAAASLPTTPQAAGCTRDALAAVLAALRRLRRCRRHVLAAAKPAAGAAGGESGAATAQSTLAGVATARTALVLPENSPCVRFSGVGDEATAESQPGAMAAIAQAHELASGGAAATVG